MALIFNAYLTRY